MIRMIFIIIDFSVMNFLFMLFVICNTGSAYCAKCNRPLSNSIVTALNQKWHPECFTCSICNDRINSEFTGIDNKPVCFKCQSKLNGTRTESIKVAGSDILCGKCNQKVQHGPIISAGHQTFHKSCFVCESCNAPITGEYNSNKDKIYCKICYNKSFSEKCQTCHFPINDSEFTVFDGHHYHHSCFRCTICGKILVGQVLSRSNTGGVCCVTHDF